MANYAGTTAVFEVRSAATSGNKGGGGFNIGNTHFIADWTATSANTSSPVLSSVSYSFVAGDVNSWVYVKSGTNWTPGWYQIASVGGGNATLSAAIGAALQITNGVYVTNTVAGCATVASPTAGNVGIDYSQQNAAQFTGTDLTGTTTSVTSASNPFGPQHAGNFLCLASGTGVTAGWYEIVSVSAATATLDRSAGATPSATTYYLGGAVSLGGSTAGITDVIFFLQAGGASATTGCRFFIKGNATYTPNAAITTAGGSGTWPIILEGYNSLRGDLPTIASGNQPILSMGANTFTLGADYIVRNVNFTGTVNNMVVLGSQTLVLNSKITNTSSSANAAVNLNNNSSMVACEIVSYNGNAVNSSANGSAPAIIGCYIHDSLRGMNVAANQYMVAINNIISGCKTAGISGSTSGAANGVYYGNTIYGAENKLGDGYQSGGNDIFLNNIVYGCVNGIGADASAFLMMSNYNCFFNNTNNISAAAAAAGAFIGAQDITATNPSFTNVAQVTGTTATSSGTTLTDSGKNFTTAGVVAGRDALQVISGTGATVAQYGITAVGTTTLTTNNTIGTSSGGNLVYQITTGRNFLPTGVI